MLLEVRDFLSIKHARLETHEHHAIIARTNGCPGETLLA